MEFDARSERDNREKGVLSYVAYFINRHRSSIFIYYLSKVSGMNYGLMMRLFPSSLILDS